MKKTEIKVGGHYAFQRYSSVRAQRVRVDDTDLPNRYREPIGYTYIDDEGNPLLDTSGNTRVGTCSGRCITMTWDQHLAHVEELKVRAAEAKARRDEVNAIHWAKVARIDAVMESVGAEAKSVYVGIRETPAAETAGFEVKDGHTTLHGFDNKDTVSIDAVDVLAALYGRMSDGAA